MIERPVRRSNGAGVADLECGTRARIPLLRGDDICEGNVDAVNAANAGVFEQRRRQAAGAATDVENGAIRHADEVEEPSCQPAAPSAHELVVRTASDARNVDDGADMKKSPRDGVLVIREMDQQGERVHSGCPKTANRS